VVGVSSSEGEIVQLQVKEKARRMKGLLKVHERDSSRKKMARSWEKADCCMGGDSIPRRGMFLKKEDQSGSMRMIESRTSYQQMDGIRGGHHCSAKEKERKQFQETKNQGRSRKSP